MINGLNHKGTKPQSCFDLVSLWLDLIWFDGPDFVFSVPQDRVLRTSGSGDASGGIVRGLLQQMTGMAARPFPGDFVS